VNTTTLQRVSRSWLSATTDLATFTRRFYERLFFVAPNLRALFPADMSRQEAKLAHTLSLVMTSLPNFDLLEPALIELGRRHATYGATSAHYDTIGDTLIWTIEHSLREPMDEATRADWRTLYAHLANVMQHGAERP
jgi:hemoglobin-like flavoprotein